MALSATQLTRIRQAIGDVDSLDLTDAQIQAVWTETDNTDTDDTYRYDAYVLLLELRLGININLVSDGYERGSSQRQQKREAIKELLDYYRGLNGNHGGTLKTGVWSFEIDTNETTT